MTKQITVKITETLPELQVLLKNTKSFLRPRIKMLIVLKNEHRFVTRTDIARSVGISYGTIGIWISLYEKGGLKTLLQVNKPGKRKYVLSQHIHSFIENKLTERNPITHKEIYRWLQEKHGVKLSLPTINNYINANFSKEIQELKLARFPEIKETLAELKEAQKKALPIIKKRIQILILLKERKISGTIDIMLQTGISTVTIKKYLEYYQKGGLKSIQYRNAGPQIAIITPEIHTVIKKYIERKPDEKLSVVYRWVQKNYLPELKYVTFYNHIRKYIAKLK